MKYFCGIIVHHFPYLLDLVWCNFLFFLNWKLILGGTFEDVEYILFIYLFIHLYDCVTAHQSKEESREMENSEKCVKYQVDYSEEN